MKTNVANRIKSLMAVSAFLMMQVYVHAQNQIGISAQAGSSNIEVNGLGVLDLLDPYIKSIVQYNVGLDYERAMGSHFAVATGAHYASRGFGMREDFSVKMLGLDVPVGARVVTRLDYVEVPVTLKYYFTDHGVSPYVKAGVSTGYAIHGKIQPKVDAIISWNLPAININLDNDLYNRLDVAGVVGAGVTIPTNEVGSFQFEVNYRHSVNDMLLDKITDIRIKSNGITAGIGYTMRF